eukprot:gene4935-8532_t
MLFDQYLAFKIISGLILFTGAIIFALVPLALSALKNKYIKEENVLRVLDAINGFGAGALLSSGFLHLLPESHEILTEAISAIQGANHIDSGNSGGHNHDMLALGHDHENKIYPYAFLVASIGIVFFYHLEKIIEVMILTLKSFKPSKKVEETTQEKKTVEKSVELENIQVEEPEEKTTVDEVDETREETNEENPEHTEETQQEVSKVVDCKHDHKNDKNQHHHGHHNAHSPDHIHHDHDHAHIDAELLNSTSTVRAAIGGFILWLSLVSHSVFDGLAIGILSEFKLWSLFLTILSHHFIAATALGTVLRNGVKNYLVSGFFILSFALTVPVGILIGILVSTIEGEVFEIVHGVSLAFTGGAFIYVAAFEIMGHTKTGSKFFFFLRTLLFSVGFAAMAIIANYG